MTWTPDRTAAPRGRRLTRTPQLPSHQPERPQSAPQSLVEPHPLGIPRILGRRARWVGARLRREA
ncbi:hypothetical protein P3T37_006501 [Kitasatospora sp. MAA4]|uniref:hypothetical protein n=1 Tax=Kitasatospora sp. MAA4 TaxID=3035093 RepID=UPI00247552A8|nr:hypothetical protein [Kitasatospora sp. MAA4]MDH6137070.1 hypothetical protein [Kitasatospora sp. MAA4]